MEVMVYIAILVIMLVIIVQVVISVTRSERDARAARSIETSAVAVLERVTREIRQADSVNLVTSTLGSHPGRLVLTGTDASGNPRTVEFYFSNDRVVLRENGVDSGALTDNTSKVTSLVFNRFATSTVQGIRTALTLESGTSTYYRTETFYSSSLIR